MTAALPSWLRPHARGWVLALHVQPGAKRSEVVGIHGERLKLRVQAPPVEGKANAAVLAFLAAALHRPRQALTLLRGDTARDKDVLIQEGAVDGDQAAAIVRALLG